MKHWRFFASIFLLGCLVIPGVSSIRVYAGSELVEQPFELGPPPKEVLNSFEVPFRLTDTKHVLVRVKLNGTGPYNFIIDTGAPALIMSKEVAKKAKAKLDKNDFGEFHLQIEGGVDIPKISGLSTDMFQLKGMNAMGLAGCQLHGVLGYNVLSQFRIQYDFTQDKLHWTKLDFQAPELQRFKGKADQGGLEFMGDIMKFIAPLMGMRPNFEMKPRGQFGILLNGDKSTEILAVLPESPASKASLEKGDKILKVKKNRIYSAKDLWKFINQCHENEKIELTVQRAEEQKTVTIQLGKGF